MNKITIVFLFLSIVGKAQTGSEIYMADLKISKTGVSLTNHKNITNRVGYDNQPHFHPDKPLIYFSSFNADGRSDIKSFNLKTAETKNFTATPEREYSPTVTPDKKFVSCIIQRDNNAQDLGEYPIDGGTPSVIINNLTVGYHAWLSQSKVLLFVLGDPNSLHLFDVSASKDTVLQQQIGRALQKIPGQNAVSFVDKSGEQWVIKKFDGKKIETICPTLPGREDLAWTPDGKIIMTDGRQFYYFNTKTDGGWKMFFSTNLSGVSRIAVSGNGKKIAFVVSE